MSEFLQLGEHISIQKGKPPLLIPFHGKGAEIYLSPEYLRNRTVGISAKASSDAVRVSDGATILLWDGSNAGEFFKAKEGIVASTMARITPDEHFYPAFFFHLLKHAERILKNQTNGTGIPHVDKEILENISAFCPGDSQQRKIAEVLDTLDTAIHQTEAIVEKLKQVKQGLLHDLLTRGVDANGELRPSYEQAPELYQDSPLGWIPKAWDVKPLGASIVLISGQHIATDLCNAAGKGVPYFTGPTDFIGATTVVTSYTTRPQVMCEVGDLLITVKGSGCGKVAVAGVRACISRQLMAIRVAEKTRSYWVAVFQSLQGQFNRMATGGNIPGIGRDQILGLEQPTPQKAEEMEAIGFRIQAIDARLTNEEAQLAKLMAQKTGLMDDLLTGRVRVTPLLAQ
jgi:type I restriction enzyme S subunit